MSKLSKASSLCLLLIFFFLFSSRPALSLRGPKLQSEPKSAQNMIDDSSSMSKIDDSSSMNKIDDSSSVSKMDDLSSISNIDDSSSMSNIDSRNAKSMIGGFFSHTFPLKGWPFPKYPPFTMVNPNIPTNPSGAQEESAKLPSSPSKGNKDGGNA